VKNAGFIGLGKLGSPGAAALSVVGEKIIFGFDLNLNISEYARTSRVPYQEARIDEFLPKADIQILDSIEICVHLRVILEMFSCYSRNKENLGLRLYNQLLI
jgi:hypothetical protein